MTYLKWSAVLLVVLFVVPQISNAQRADLPSELDEYYSAHNFAVAFSTPAERSALTRFSSAETVRDSVGSARLARVYDYMQEVTAREIETDPGIFTGPKKPRGEWYHSSDLITVKHVEQSTDNRLIVEVTVHQLDEEDNLHFIRAFEEDNSQSLRDRFTRSFVRTFTRYHEWTKSGGSWKKRAAHVQLLGEGS